MPEELIVRLCSPTLAGIKIASMFNCKCHSPSELKKPMTLGKFSIRTLREMITGSMMDLVIRLIHIDKAGRIRSCILPVTVP